MQKNDTINLFFSGFSGKASVDQINFSASYIYNSLIKEAKKYYLINYSDLVPQLYLYKKDSLSVIRISNVHNVSYTKIQLKIENNSFEMPLLEKWRYKEFTFPLIEEIKHNVSLSYISKYNQPLSHSFVLKYGETTGEEEADLEEQEKQPSQKTIPEKKNLFEIKIDKNTLLIVGGVILGLVVAFVIFSLLKNRFSKSELDKEIEEIKKDVEKIDDEVK